MPELDPELLTPAEIIETFIAERSGLAERVESWRSQTVTPNENTMRAFLGESIPTVPEDPIEDPDNSNEFETFPNCTCRSCSGGTVRPSTREEPIPPSTQRDDRRTAAAKRLP